ncbi:cilia- and flagella-associated protein 47-like [Homalodisca vitripennis]|uniref:cilia- and flagella-associated protein 47-like n=1 Tax=Homalodisca vitripennis TaxID=197043 RepID=UPI001EEBEBA7|nr:cilia- and flagella-associated protein 47-like [Homalodisca vitripennis]
MPFSDYESPSDPPDDSDLDKDYIPSTDNESTDVPALEQNSTLEFSNPIASEIVELSLQSDVKEDKCLEKSVVATSVAVVEGDLMPFPLFPVDVTVTEYAIHMHQTCEAVQQWFYEQVFNCSYYPVLGSHCFSTLAQSSKKEYGRSPPVAMRNVFDVLERICGRNVRRYFTPLDKQPEDPNGKVMFVYFAYKQLVDFMKAQGALINHVEPKYLMSYDDYCVYSQSSDKKEECNNELLSIGVFKCVTTQCWLDLFLQIYRTLILGPTVGVKVGMLDQEAAVSEVPHKTKYGRPEDVLMSWLTHHYNTQRLIVWPDKPSRPRTVTNLDSDLEDGLVLATVTAAYCPFLSPLHFQAMFTQPTTVSQAYHNTVCLTSAWDKIRLGYSVTPRDLMRPNVVNMLMLVAHLYRNLSSYKLETTVSFMATLNTSETQVVTLENSEESAVTYHIEILPNNSSFEIDDMKDSFVLKNKQRGEIVVRYTARSMVKVDAILLLCGACMPPKFGRNYVFGLEGHPVKLPVSAIFNIISPLNTAAVTHISVETPHTLEQGGATVLYDIWTTMSEPQPGNLNALSWAKERKRRVPRRLFILSEMLEIQPIKRNKSGQLRLQVCCFSQAVQHYWIIFKNAEIGDFIVQLQITPSAPEPSLTLVVSLSCLTRCNCVGEKQFICSRSAVVNVPCRNLDQWSAVRTMFELTIPSSEKEFWATYLESNIGFRLLQWMLEEKKEKLTEEVEQIFKKSKTYKVTCSSPNVFCNPVLQIPNVRARTSVPIHLHIDEDTPNQSTTLTLTSTDGQESRCYLLNISCNG